MTRELLDPVPGAAHVFRRAAAEGSEAVWAQEAVLSPNAGTETPDWFGFALDAAAGVVAVGAYFEGYDPGVDTTGAVYLYRRSGAGWALEARLPPPGVTWFGNAVALDLRAERLLVGTADANCPLGNGGGPQCGAAFLYDRPGGSWALRQTLRLPDAVERDLFGSLVGLADGYALVTAPRRRINGENNSGAAYLYGFDGDQLRLLTELVSPDPGRLDEYGRRAALSEGHALVGTLETLGAAYAVDLAYATPTEPAPSPPTEGMEPVHIGARPNPATDTIRLDYALTEPGTVEVEVLDALGRLVWHQDLGQRAAGAHGLEVEAGGWPAGRYLARLTTEGGVVTVPFTLLVP